MSVLNHFVRWRLGVAPAETQTTEAERAALAEHARDRRTLVEIGCWHGVTTRLLRSVMAADGALYAVDPYPAGRLGVNFQQIIARAEVGRVPRATVRWIRHGGAEALAWSQREGLNSVDFIFIDGLHTYDGLREDWENWSPLLTAGGIVALHDSRSTPTRDLEDAGSARFTREMIVPDDRFKVIGEVDSLTLLRRLPIIIN